MSLRDELLTDPLGRGYAAMTDEHAAVDLNTVYRSRNRATMTASEVYNAVDQTEWAALTSAQQAEIWDIVHMGDQLNPFGREAARFQTIFGAGTTITALQAARIEAITRAQELPDVRSPVKVGHVTVARAV